MIARDLTIAGLGLVAGLSVTVLPSRPASLPGIGPDSQGSAVAGPPTAPAVERWDPINDETSFAIGDSVRVRRGVYRGCRGHVTGPCLAGDGIERYGVRFTQDTGNGNRSLGEAGRAFGLRGDNLEAVAPGRGSAVSEPGVIRQ